MDDGVQLPVHLDVETGGGERVPLTDRVHPPRERRGDLLGHTGQGPDLGPPVGLHARAQPLLVEVVHVLVGDQDGVGADRRVPLAEDTRVDDEHLPSFSSRTQA